MDKNQFLSEKIKKLIQEGYSRSQASAIAYGQLNKASYAQQAEYPMYPDELKENGYATEIVPNQSDYSEITEDDTVDQLEYEPQKEVWQMWQEKTGLPWKEAKRLGYTDGSAKDNMKLLQEITSDTFNVNKLRKNPVTSASSKKANIPSKEAVKRAVKGKIPPKPNQNDEEDNTTYNGGELNEVIIRPVRRKAPFRGMFTSEDEYQKYLRYNKLKGTPNYGITNPPVFEYPRKKEYPMFRQAMQQGGGLDMLKGKRIVDYKYNPRTGNYDIEYED